MATVEGAEIVWTSADLTGLENDKLLLEELIDQIEDSGTAALRTEYQDPCSAYVRLLVANAPPPTFPALEAQRDRRAAKKGAPAKDKKPRKR